MAERIKWVNGIPHIREYVAWLNVIPLLEECPIIAVIKKK